MNNTRQISNTQELQLTWREENVIARKIAWFILRCAERLVLAAYGWKRCEGETLNSSVAWVPADGHPKAGEYYDHDHAMNSTKFYANRRTPAGAEGKRVRSRRRGRWYE